MKLRNKKTGEIVEFRYLQSDYVAPLVLSTRESDKPEMYTYNSLAELNEEWEDAPEEPKKHYEILAMGAVVERVDAEDEIFRNQGQREIGNYFESLEEAEKAVEKLKAFKRLKDKGFRFDGWYESVSDNNPDKVLFRLDEDAWETDTCDDLDLLFGGEE